jgi:hypothetical protein
VVIEYQLHWVPGGNSNRIPSIRHDACRIPWSICWRICKCGHVNQLGNCRCFWNRGAKQPNDRFTSVCDQHTLAVFINHDRESLATYYFKKISRYSFGCRYKDRVENMSLSIPFWPLASAILCLMLAISSLPFMYLPVTELEQKLWHKLNIRILRHWVSRKGTEKWPQKSTLQNIIDRSRKNIAWHGIMTLTFCLLMVQTQSLDIKLIQVGSSLFVIPSIAYFVGSVIQRQKLVIILIRKIMDRYGKRKDGTTTHSR